jgi:hypothetical protein
LGWQMSGQVQVITTRSKHDNTPPISSWRNRSDPPHACENSVLRDTPKFVWQDRLQRYASIETLAGQGRTAKCNFPDTTFSSSTKRPSGD